MVFKSKHPDIEYPTDLTVWEWAFEDPRHSPLFNYPSNEIAGFVNAATWERLSFYQVKEHATHLCTALVKRYNLQVSDTVSFFSQNTIWYPVGMFATLRAECAFEVMNTKYKASGGRVNGASPAYTVDEMSHALKTANSKYIMTVPSSMTVALAAANEAGIPKEHIILLEGEYEDFVTVKQLLQIGKSYGKYGQSPIYCIPAGQTNNICGYLNFSSGTTGLPKAVMLSHQNVIAQCLQLKAVAGPERKRFLASLPLFHSKNLTVVSNLDSTDAAAVSGLVRFLHWPIASNDECVMLSQFSMEGFLEAIVRYQITDLTLVPSIVLRLVHDPIVDRYDVTCVKRIACGAAPLGSEVIQQLREKMPWTGFRQSYGMTESCCCITTHPPEFYSYDYANNAGTLLGSTVVKVIDMSTGKELGPNKTGEVLAKGPQIALGYLGNQEETAETFGTDGFLRTGDVGMIDDQGFIRIVDRTKEMIKVKGLQVAPAELENILLGHPDVGDCAVLGIPDPYSAERPKAYVVLKPNINASDVVGHSLINYVKEKLVRYKWIKEVEFIAEIPKSPSSKILRRVLREKQKEGSRGHVVRDVSERPRL